MSVISSTHKISGNTCSLYKELLLNTNTASRLNHSSLAFFSTVLKLPVITMTDTLPAHNCMVEMHLKHLDYFHLLLNMIKSQRYTISGP